MRRLTTGLILGSSLLIACGDDGAKSPDAEVVSVGFDKPTIEVHANDEAGAGVWTDLGPADLTCLNTPSTDMPTAQAVTLNTVVKDFQSDKLVTGAAVTAFTGIDFGNPFGAAVTSDGQGLVTVAIPAGQRRIGFKMAGGVSGSTTQLDTFLLNQYLDPAMAIQTSPELLSVSDSTAQLLPALIGQPRTPGSGVIAGALRDCQGREMSNFVATVSSTPGTATLLDGASTYYFSKTSSPLPQKHNVLQNASSNGLYMVIQIPATTTAYVQMWGYKTAAAVGGDMSLLAELQVPVIADSVVTGSYNPKRN